MLTLDRITRDNWHEALGIRVQPEKLAWVASAEPVAMILLAKCQVRPDGQVWHPFLLRADETAVGIVGIGVDPDDAAGGTQSAWVHHFLIDSEVQGRGLGREAMLAMFAWLRREHPTIRRVGLNVLAGNAAAFALYSSLGFAPLGLTRDEQTIMLAEL